MSHSKKVRVDGLTDGRIYGRLCDKHPELNGLRELTKKKYIAAHDVVSVYEIAGSCIGCRRERDSSSFSGVLHFGSDAKYGGTWQDLWGAVSAFQ
jgi:hypothetical protein